MQTLTADSDWATIAHKRSTLHVKDEWAEGELGSHAMSLAKFARFRNFSAVNLRLFRPTAAILCSLI
jgi:hypothetical protein